MVQDFLSILKHDFDVKISCFLWLMALTWQKWYEKSLYSITFCTPSKNVLLFNITWKYHNSTALLLRFCQTEDHFAQFKIRIVLIVLQKSYIFKKIAKMWLHILTEENLWKLNSPNTSFNIINNVVLISAFKCKYTTWV